MMWLKQVWRRLTGRFHEDCSSCWEMMPINECPKSKRSCGHHCNCSWSQDECDWCGKEFGEEDAA